MRHLLDILRADLDYKDDSSLKSLVSSSPWDEVMKGRSQDEASSYLDGLVMGQHRPVDFLPSMDETEAKLQLRDDALAEPGTGDYTPIGADERDGDHHQEDDAQTDQEGEGDPLHDHVLSSLDGRGSPTHEEGDLLPDVSGTEEDTFSASGDPPNSRQISKKADDLESLEDLQQSFSEVVQGRRGGNR